MALEMARTMRRVPYALRGSAQSQPCVDEVSIVMRSAYSTRAPLPTHIQHRAHTSSQRQRGRQSFQ